MNLHCLRNNSKISLSRLARHFEMFKKLFYSESMLDHLVVYNNPVLSGCGSIFDEYPSLTGIESVVR